MAVSTDYIPISEVDIKVDGTRIDRTLQNHIVELRVDSDRLLPDMFEVQFYTPDTEVLDSGTFDIGKRVEITVQQEVLIKGEITAIEPEFTRSGYVQLAIRGYDKSHRLHRGQKTRVFANMTDSDIVQKIAREAGLQVSVDSTSVTHPHVWQNNQTDMAFIRERARRLGYVVYVEDETLYFKKDAPASGQPVELEWGGNLRSFRPRIAATHQSDKVIVQGWDPGEKKAVVGQATRSSGKRHQGGVKEEGGAKARQAFNKPATTVVVDYPGITDGEAKEIAQALYNQIQDRFVQAEGVCIGNPKVKAGRTVKITDVGEKLSGTYVVTSATHIFDPVRGYETHFVIRGRQPDVMTYLLEGRRTANPDRALINGVVVAVVTDTNDPEGLGRVKVKFPWLDEQLESHWVRVAAPGAGQKRGIYYIPEVNDEVLIAFEHGDINQPYVLGGLWNGKDEPPKKTSEVVADGKVVERIIRSRAGHVIILNDAQDKEQIIIRDKTEKNEIIIDSKTNTMTINVTQDYRLTTEKGEIATSSGKATTITSGDTTTIDSKGNITVKSQATATITIEAGGQVTVKGKGITVESTTGDLTLKAGAGKVSIQGLQVSIQASTQAELKGSAMVQIQGGLVKIN